MGAPSPSLAETFAEAVDKRDEQPAEISANSTVMNLILAGIIRKLHG
jgi:hypothetical protein